jgi:hypothetical protein
MRGKAPIIEYYGVTWLNRTERDKLVELRDVCAVVFPVASIVLIVSTTGD